MSPIDHASNERPVLDASGSLRAAPYELSIVSPTLNELANIPRLYEALAGALGGVAWELVIVDDDSKDGSAQLLRDMALRQENFRFVRRVGRSGLSTAVIEGMLTCPSPYIAVMDVDGQHDVTVLPAMIEKMREGYDLAVGSRFAPGAVIEGFPPERLRLSVTANRLTQRFYGVEVEDSNTGFFMIGQPALERVVRRLPGRGFKILLDILLAGRGDLKIVELPIHFGVRTEGDSKLSSFVMIEYALQLYDAKFGRLLPAKILLDLVLIFATALLSAIIANGLFEFGGLRPGLSIVLAMLPIIAALHHFALKLVPKRKRPKGSARWTDLALYLLICAPFLMLGYWLAEGLVGTKYLRAFFAAALPVCIGLLLANGWRREVVARR